jgi:PAS domain S-box-containing protein
MREALRVLLVEDTPADAALLLRELRRSGFEPEWRRVDTEADYLEALNPDLDIILSDYSMPQFDGPRALQLLQEGGFDISFIIVSGTIGEDAAVAAMRQGAHDYLLKDRLTRLGPAVRQALEQRRQRAEGKRISAALASADAKYRNIFENAVNGIFQTTLDGRFLAANPAMAHICGYGSPEELIASVTSLKDQLYADPARRDEFERLAEATEVISGFEAEIRRKDGSLIWVSSNACVVRDEHGNRHYEGSVVDISQRKRAEAELREASERYQRTLDAMFEGCQIISRDWRYLYVNEAAARHGRQPREALLGRRMGEVYPGIEGAPVFAAMQRCQAERVSAQLENEFLYADGSSAWFELSLQPVPEGLFILTIDITERKRVEAALRANQSQLRSFVEQAPADLAMFDCNMVCLAASQRWVRDYGRGHPSLVGLNHYDVHPDLPERWREIHRRGLAGEAQECDEDLWIHADGSEHWLRWAVHPWRDAGGEIGGIMIITEDTTPRKQAEAAVREGEARLSGVVNSAMDAIITVNTEQHIVLFNAAAERMFRCSREQAMGRPIDVFIPARFREGHGQHVRQFGTTGVTSRSMGVLGAISGLRADGEEFPIEASISQTDVAGKRLSTVILRDITERRRLERWQAMQHTVTRVLAGSTSLRAAAAGIIQAVCETLGGKFGAIWEIDRQANVLRCSDLWHLPGLSAEELSAQTRKISFAPGIGLPGRVWATGKPLVLSDVARDANFPRAASATKAGLSGAFGFPILLRGEVAGVVDFLGPEMRQPEPEQLAMLAAIGIQIGQFIEHRSAGEQLLQAQKMEAVGQLAGGIAHDFNNLLGVILGYDELASRELGANHPAHRRIEAIREAVERAAALTRQILTFSRKQAVEVRVCNLNHIVEEMEKMLRRLIGEDVRLAVALGEGLGRVRADPSQLEQVIMNLAVNARDAMPSGGRMVIETSNVDLDEAYVRSHPEARPGPYVMLAVRDSGVGMEPATRARIFEPFFTTKELGKGTGLGLAVVYGIVKQSGGSLSVDSEPGRGSTFRIHLPRTDAPASKAPTISPNAAVGGSEVVLLLEDEQALREIVAETLRTAGYTVLEAPDPKEALAVAARSQRPIQLLITDVVLPGQSGPETAVQIRKAQPGVRVLLMSGYAERRPDENVVIEPGTPFLSKPFTIDALLGKVRAVLDSREPILPES